MRPVTSGPERTRAPASANAGCGWIGRKAEHRAGCGDGIASCEAASRFWVEGEARKGQGTRSEGTRSAGRQRFVAKVEVVGDIFDVLDEFVWRHAFSIHEEGLWDNLCMALSLPFGCSGPDLV